MNKLIQNGLFFKDKIVTAKHTIVGEDLERSILKATTDEIALPKKKYIDYLVICTRDETISILEMSKGIMDRVHNPNWVVAFKALLVVHELMNYSNERFFQYMASDSSSLKLDTFSDRKDASSLFMSQMVRLYSHYISVKAVSFRVVGYDFCKVKRGGKDGFFKTLDSKKLFSSLSQLHNQLDVLLAFKPNLDELRNCVAVEGYKMAFKDLVRLVACLNDANANLLEHFADYNRKDCQQALILYKKFPLYIKRVTKHYELAESFSFEPVQLPSLNQVPQDLQSMMEEQLKNMENNTKTTISPSALPKPASRPPNSRRMSMPVSALPLSNTPSLFTQPSTCTQTSTSTNVSSPALTSLSLEKLSFDDNFKELTLNGVSYKEREKALLEEQKVLQEFKAKKEEASRRELVQTNNNTNNNNNNKISNNANNTFNNNNSFSNSNSSFNNYNIFDTNTAFDSAFNNFNNNDNNSFASFDATSITSINTIPILTPQPSVGSPLSSSLPPGFLDENMFQSPKERKSSSPSTPLQLDFSKVSLPPSNSMHPYNQMYPISPTHFSPGAFLPSNVPLNNYNWQQGNQTTQNPFF